MFKHHTTPAESQPAVATGSTEKETPPTPAELPQNETNLKELIEKNLKWSQIIYEQNRKLNNKLLWMAVGSWLKVLVIILPLVAAVLFLSPVLKNVWSQYGSLLGVSSGSNDQKSSNPNSLDGLIKMLNLDPAKQEQLKALLK